MSLTETWADRFDKFFTIQHSTEMIKGFMHTEIQRVEMDTRQECLRSETFRLNKLLLRQVEQCVSVIQDAPEPLSRESLIKTIQTGLL